MDLSEMLHSFNQLDWNVTNFVIDQIYYINSNDSVTIPNYNWKYLFNKRIKPLIYKLILYLPLDTKNVPSTEQYLERLEYKSEYGFTPFDILGAINTFYLQPINRDLIYKLADEGYLTSLELKNLDQNGKWSNRSLSNSYLLSWVGQIFKGLEPYKDGYKINIGM